MKVSVYTYIYFSFPFLRLRVQSMTRARERERQTDREKFILWVIQSFPGEESDFSAPPGQKKKEQRDIDKL